MKEFRNRYDEIKLWYEAQKEKIVVVMVEAKADELFFRKFFSKKTTFFSTDGYEYLLEVMNEINKNNDKGVIGIIDADFRRIDNEKIESDNLFITDGHDCEMMTINSQAWDEVFDFHVDRNKLDRFQRSNRVGFKKYIFDLSKKIGYIRYLNKKENLGLVFKTFKKDKANFIDYYKFIDKDNLKINIDSMIKTIENKSSKQNLFRDNPELKIKLDEICSNKYELIEFCNGHDFINIFAFSLQKVLNNQNISGLEIENKLIIAYRYDDFKKTELFRLLLEWEKNNSIYLLFNN